MKNGTQTRIAIVTSHKWLLFSFTLLAGFSHIVNSETLQSETLQEGVWKGTYSVSQYQAKYYVTNTTAGDAIKPSIKMVLPELEPRIDFTYELKDVFLSDTSLSFTIHKKNEIQKCTLEKHNTDLYTGSCRSDADKDGAMLVEISMIPPGETKKDAATSVETENKPQE